MATELFDPKPIIDPTEHVATAQQKLDKWTRKGQPRRQFSTSDATTTIDPWDLISAVPSDSSQAETVYSETVNVTLNLPSISTDRGRQIRLVNVGISSTTVNADGTDTVDGTGSITLLSGDAVTLEAAIVFGGTSNWYIV